MNGVVEFLLWCVIIATCVGIGTFVIQFVLVAVFWLIVLILGSIGWVFTKLAELFKPNQ
jgi:hypothetical protein